MVSYCSPCDFGWMVCPVDVESVVIFNKMLVCLGFYGRYCQQLVGVWVSSLLFFGPVV